MNLATGLAEYLAGVGLARQSHGLANDCSMHVYLCELLTIAVQTVQGGKWIHHPITHTQVFYGCAVTDPMDSIVLTALTEHWAHSGGCKREPGRYHIPSHFFTPGTKLSVLTQAVEGASPPLAFTAELCGLYFTPAVSVDQLISHHGCIV